MTDTTDFTTIRDNGEAKLPGGINVLTILTFIGSAIALIFSAAYPWINNFLKSIMDKAVSSGAEMSAKDLQQIQDGRKALDLAEANMVPIVVVGIVGAILCIAGAVMMRKLKKDGFWIYLGGELLPLIAGFVLMGTAQYNGVFSIIIGVGLPVLFIVLYARQRKYLVK